MSDPSGLRLFFGEVEGDITADVQPGAGNPADFREAAFTRLLTEELEQMGILESPVVCHFERGRSASAIKVSGYGIPEEDSRLDLFVTVYEHGDQGEVPTLNAAEVDSAFGRLERFLDQANKGLHENLDPALPEYPMVERIHQLYGKVDRINFLLLTNCRLSARREKKRRPKLDGVSVTHDIWDIERFRRFRESGAVYEALPVDLRTLPEGGLPCVQLDSQDTGFRTCIAIFPGTLLRDLYDEHGSRLLELNVRSYLQAKGKINKGILETLKKDPQDFMAYNNGITVVAEEIVFGRLNDGQSGIHEIKGMQIVNGGQTTASIHRASKEHGADLSRVFIQGKIVTVDRERFNSVVPQISRYSNTQNKVSEPDLQANHRFHVGLERVSKREWSPDQSSLWFYERARGSYQTARSREGTTEARRRDYDKKHPPNQRVEKEDLARYDNCWRGLPHIVNRGRQKNFTHFMTLVKEELGELPDRWEPSPEAFHRYMAKAILYREVQRIVKADTSITAYAINITNYTVSMLAHRTARRINLDDIWKKQRIGEELADLAKAWAPVIHCSFVDYARGQQVHTDNTLKSQASWEHLLSLDLRVPDSVESGLVSNATPGSSVMLSSHHKGQKLSGSDLNNVNRCMELSAAQWMAILSWGNGAGKMAPWQLGVATTLASYAAAGWARKPSPKQAKHGAVMIDGARAGGIIAH